MAVNDIFPAVRTAAEMVAAGVMRLSAWLYSQIPRQPQRLAFLRGMFPGVSQANAQQMLQLMRQAAAAGPVLSSGGTTTGPNLQAALRLGGTTEYVYQARVMMTSARQGGNPGEIEVVFRSADELSGGDLDNAARDAATNEIQQVRSSYPNAWRGYDPFDPGSTYTILAAWVE